MGLEVLKSKIQKITTGQTRFQKERTIKEHFSRWSSGGAVISLPQFRMALSDLGVPGRASEDIFAEFDQTRQGNINIQTVLSRLIETREVPEHPLSHVRGTLQDQRSITSLDLSGAQEPQMPAGGSQALSAPASPAGLRRSLPQDPEAIKQAKIKGFWDLIGNRAKEKGFRSVPHLLKAIDKDSNGQLDRMEVRGFFKVTLSLAMAKADEFFSLLDEDRDGKVDCKLLARCLAPYLQKNFRPDIEVPAWHDDTLATEESTRAKEVTKFWELLGNRAFDKGFKSAGQMMLQMDKDDNGVMDKKEMRTFLTHYAAFSAAASDRFFDLLDVNQRGKISCKEIKRCLEPYFHKSILETDSVVPAWRSNHNEMLEKEEAQKELRRFWEMIGSRFFAKGSRSAGQVLMLMDTQNSGFVDRSQVRTFFQRHMGQGTAVADHFFDLLDPNNVGTVSCRALGVHLAPYFQNTVRKPGDIVADWEASPAPEVHAAGCARMSGAGTPGRPGMTRQSSAPGWTPQSASPGVRNSFGGGEGGSALQQMASPDASMERRSMVEAPPGRRSTAPFGEHSFGGPPPLDSSVRSFATDLPLERPLDSPADVGPDSESSASRSRPSEFNAPLRGAPVLEEAPPPDSRGPPAVAWGRQVPFASQPPPLPAAAAAAAHGPPEAVDLSAVVLAEFRRVILSRGGTHGIHQFGRTFRIMDTSRNMQVSAAELETAARRFGLDLMRRDLVLLMAAVDRDGSGTIDCTEFLRAVRGPVAPRRQQLINTAFDFLDRNANDRIEVLDIQHMYDVSQHPEVVARRMSQDAALEHFLSQFEGASHDGFVTRKEFSEYYANISASIDDDDHFELLMRNAWRGGRNWPVPLTGQGHREKPEPDSYVQPRPRRVARWNPDGLSR